VSNEIVSIDTFNAWASTVKQGIDEGAVNGFFSLQDEKWFVRKADGWAYVDHVRDGAKAKPTSPTLYDLIEQIDMKLDRVLELLCDDDDLEDADL
jgi:hypothetical protein